MNVKIYVYKQYDMHNLKKSVGMSGNFFPLFINSLYTIPTIPTKKRVSYIGCK